jgi:hypothetical protein
LDGCLAECLLHAWAKDSHHHLLERTKESFVVPAQDMVRGISERLYALLPLLLGGGVALSWQQYSGHLILQVQDATPVLLEGQHALLLELVHCVLELLPLFWGEVFNVDIHDVPNVRHLDLFGCGPTGRAKKWTQNVHLAPSTQQAEQAGFTCAMNHKTCQSIFPKN